MLGGFAEKLAVFMFRRSTMPTITKKKLKNYKKMCYDRERGRGLTIDGLRLICVGLAEPQKPSGSIFLNAGENPVCK